MVPMVPRRMGEVPLSPPPYKGETVVPTAGTDPHPPRELGVENAAEGRVGEAF